MSPGDTISLVPQSFGDAADFDKLRRTSTASQFATTHALRVPLALPGVQRCRVAHAHGNGQTDDCHHARSFQSIFPAQGTERTSTYRPWMQGHLGWLAHIVEPHHLIFKSREVMHSGHHGLESFTPSSKVRRTSPSRSLTAHSCLPVRCEVGGGILAALNGTPGLRISILLRGRGDSHPAEPRGSVTDHHSDRTSKSAQLSRHSHPVNGGGS